MISLKCDCGSKLDNLPTETVEGVPVTYCPDCGSYYVRFDYDSKTYTGSVDLTWIRPDRRAAVLLADARFLKYAAARDLAINSSRVDI